MEYKQFILCAPGTRTIEVPRIASMRAVSVKPEDDLPGTTFVVDTVHLTEQQFKGETVFGGYHEYSNTFFFTLR